MYIISYDVASKSLAVSIMQFNDNWAKDLADINLYFNSAKIDSATDMCNTALIAVNRIKLLLETLFTPIYLDVVDLIPNKKIKETDLILRSCRLKAYLENFDKISNQFDNCRVLVEYQMGPNNKSNNVFSQLLYHYAYCDTDYSSCYDTDKTIHQKKYSIEVVGPSLKNKINLDKSKPLSFFINKYATSYDANKKHSTHNMLWFLQSINKEFMLKNIKKSNYDDIADSITMTIAWCLNLTSPSVTKRHSR
jgi:hypothetical protein